MEKQRNRKKKNQIKYETFSLDASFAFRFRLRFSFVYSFRIEEQTDKTSDAFGRSGVRRERDGERSKFK